MISEFCNCKSLCQKISGNSVDNEFASGSPRAHTNSSGFLALTFCALTLDLAFVIALALFIVYISTLSPLFLALITSYLNSL